MRVRQTRYGHEISSANLDEIMELIVNDRIKNQIAWRNTHVIPITPAKFYVAIRSNEGMLLGVWRFHPRIKPFPLYQNKIDEVRKIEHDHKKSS